MTLSPESSFVYFGDVPDRLVAGEYPTLGNVAMVPPDQLPDFMQNAAPDTLEAWYEMHKPPTAARLGSLALLYTTSGGAVEVTDQARSMIASVQSLIDTLPDNFRLDFPGDDRQASLRLQKTTNSCNYAPQTALI